jgi:hypothetical protein
LHFKKGETGIRKKYLLGLGTSFIGLQDILTIERGWGRYINPNETGGARKSTHNCYK